MHFLNCNTEELRLATVLLIYLAPSSTSLFPKLLGIFSVGLYPYGNAHESQLPDGSWKFECQHGQPECTGNIIEVCIEVTFHISITSVIESTGAGPD